MSKLQPAAMQPDVGLHTAKAGIERIESEGLRASEPASVFGGWLKWSRGQLCVLVNLSDQTRVLPMPDCRLLLRAGEATIGDGNVQLGAQAVAIVRTAHHASLRRSETASASAGS